MLSIVIPVYRNAESIPGLVGVLGEISRRVRREHGEETEAVFVVDGSPDRSHAVLMELLPGASFSSHLLLHARNFGSFAAIRSGLAAATGDYFTVMAADLQEPPDLTLRFVEKLMNEGCDVVVGCREARSDPLGTRVLSTMFWRSYRRFVLPEIPANGVDVFACNRAFRDQLLALHETNTSLVGLIYWLGFRRSEVYYERLPRAHGRSAWTLGRKINYFLDSVFAFTDLPIRVLTVFGLLGIATAMGLGTVVLLARLLGDIAVPGYAATVLTIIFFGGINSLGLGIVGAYAWRTYENTKGRPLAVVMRSQSFRPVVAHERGTP